MHKVFLKSDAVDYIARGLGAGSMNPTPMIFRDTTDCRILSFAEAAQYPVLSTASMVWLKLRGNRKVSSRKALSPREITSILSNVSLIRVIDAGQDYEHRIVGDAVSRVYRPVLHGRLSSQIAKDAPLIAKRWTEIFSQVLASKAPLGVEATVGSGHPEVSFKSVRAIALPFGEEDGCIDHLMTASLYQLCGERKI